MTDGYQVKVRPEKVAAVQEIKERFERAQAAVLTEYRGLTVTELGALRSALGAAEVEYRVAKNTMTRIAADELGLEGIAELCEGPTAIAYCFGDPVLAAKALTGFAKDHPALVIKGAILEGRFMTADEAESLARVDTLEVSLAKIAGSLTAPLQAIVGVLEAPLQQILFVLEQASSWASAEAGAPSEAPPSEAEATAEPEAEATAEPEAASEPEAEAAAEPEAEATAEDGSEQPEDGQDGTTTQGE